MTENPRHLSDSAEHYTPAFLVHAAHSVMGGVDLDPASCEFANRLICADAFYTAEDDGFVRRWRGRVFLNPPGGRSDNMQRRVLTECSKTAACGLPIGHKHDGVESSQKKWWFKLAREFFEGRVSQAIFVCFSVELLQTTQVGDQDPSIPLDFPICFASRRVPYDRDIAGERTSGKSPPHASCIIYLGPNVDRFHKVFSEIGRVRL